MKIHKRTDISSSSSLTAYDIASAVRILSGQKLIIYQEDKTLAEYADCTAVERDRDNLVMRMTVDLIGWLKGEMIIYVR